MTSIPTRRSFLRALPVSAMLPFASPPERARAAPSTQTVGVREGSFCRELWDRNRDVYEAILAHPFLTGLQDGTLERSSFAFYMMQDAHYLRAFGEALTVVAKKAPKPEWATLLARHGAESLQEELRLHSSVFAEYGITRSEVEAMQPAPEAFGYTSFLVATAHTGSFAEAIASLLPCYWIYLEVGLELVKRGSKDATYQKWIANYSSPAYATTVREVIAIVDDAARPASERERGVMHAHYRRSSQYEWMFWDSAFHRRRWPLPPARPQGQP